MKKTIIISIMLTLLIVAVVAMTNCHKVEKTPIRETATGTTAEATTETTTEKITKATTKATTTKAETTTKVFETLPEKANGNYIGRFYITGYTAEEGFGEGSATASGVGCRPGICAMNDTRRKELGIKYGDTIYIEGLGAFKVQDCGCGYNVVDIWCYTNAEAFAITGSYEVYFGE